MVILLGKNEKKIKDAMQYRFVPSQKVNMHD